MLVLLSFLIFSQCGGTVPQGLDHSLMPQHNQILMEHSIETTPDITPAFSKSKTLFSGLPYGCFPNSADLKSVDLSKSGIKVGCLGGSCSFPLPDTPLYLNLTFNFCDKQDDILYLKQYLCIDGLSLDLVAMGKALDKESSYIGDDYNSLLTKMGISAKNGCFLGPIEQIDLTKRKGFGYWKAPKIVVTPIYIVPAIEAQIYATVTTNLPVGGNYSSHVTLYTDFSDNPGFGGINVTILNVAYTYGNQKSFTLKSQYNPPVWKAHGSFNW